MATMDPDTVDALNMLLEDVRASVEIEVALSNGATEYLEREALTAMGVEDTLLAFRLRDWLASHDLPVTGRINGIVLQALDLTRYDDRLTLFMHHQLASREQAEQLLEDADEADGTDETGETGETGETDLDRAGKEILRSLVDAHTRHATWSEARAREFAETRQFEFRIPGPRPNGPSDGADSPDSPDAPESADPPETSGERSFPRGARTVAAPATEPDFVDNDEDDEDEGGDEDEDEGGNDDEDEDEDGDYDIDDMDDIEDVAPVSERPPAE